MRKITLNSLVMFFLFLSTGLILYIYYLSFWPIDVVTLNSFVVKSNPVYRGEFIEYQLDFTKHKNITPKITYFLINGTVIELENGGMNRPLGKSTVVLLKRIPESTYPGEHRLRIELEYPITAWRSIRYSWTSNTFTVL